MVTCNARDKFLLAKSTKKVLRKVNSINLKTPSGYIAKSKPQGVCLQLGQTLGGDYAIWRNIFTSLFPKFESTTNTIISSLTSLHPKTSPLCIMTLFFHTLVATLFKNLCLYNNPTQR